MRRFTLYVLAMLIAYSWTAYSATNCYIIIEGTKQGLFKGESNNQKHSNAIEALSYNYSITSPKDLSTGATTGKRQHQPVVIVKEWGAASPQLFQSVFTNEILKKITIQLYNTNSDGAETLFQTITLTNASIFKIRQFIDNPNIVQGIGDSSMPLEEISFTFQKIQIDNNAGQTSASDNWKQ